MASSRSWRDPECIRMQVNFHETDRQRFYAAKNGAEDRIGRELTHGDFVELLLDVYDLHLDDKEDDTHGN